jgi:hypothetical protein
MIIDFDTVKIGDIIEAELDLAIRPETIQTKLMVVSLDPLGFSYNGKRAYDVELFVFGENETVLYQTYDSKYYEWDSWDEGDDNVSSTYECCLSQDEDGNVYHRRIRFIGKAT